MFAYILANTGSATPSSISPYGTGGFWGALLGLGVFFLVIIGAYLLHRWFLTRAYGGAGHSRIRVLERSVVGRDAYMMLIQVEDRVLLVGANKENMSLLCDLSSQEATATVSPGAKVSLPSDPSVAGTTTFGQRFIHNMKIQTGILPKGTKPGVPESLPDTVASDTAQAATDTLEPVVSDVPDDVIPTSEPPQDDSTADRKKSEETEPEPTPEQTAASFAEIMRRVQNAATEGSRGSAPQHNKSDVSAPPAPSDGGKGYDDAINSMRQLSQISEEQRVKPVAARAAAATYAAAKRASVPAQKTESQPSDQAEDVLDALREQRRIRALDSDTAPHSQETPVPNDTSDTLRTKDSSKADERPGNPAQDTPPAEDSEPPKQSKRAQSRKGGAPGKGGNVKQRKENPPASTFTAVADDSLAETSQTVMLAPVDEPPVETEPAKEPAPKRREKSKRGASGSERQNAMQKLAARTEQSADSDMDELMDRIQKRSNRYTSYGRKE